MTNTRELKSFLVKRNISAGKLADELGISRVSLSKKINNKREFKASEIVKIQKLLALTNVERDYIFFGIELTDINQNATN